jgi:biotin operon repressor
MAITLDQAQEIWEFVGHKHANIRIELQGGQVFDQFANGPKELCETLNEFNGKGNLWIGINERRENGTKNEDIITVRNIVLDVEPKNLEKNQYPSEAQLQECLDVVQRVKTWCSERGINTVAVFSGKGFHVWLPLKDIPVNDANRGEIIEKYRLFHEKMSELFSTKTVRLDPAVKDLARVIGIPYTVNVKWGKERKPPTRLERLPGDKAAEFMLSIKPTKREPVGYVGACKLSGPIPEMPPCAHIAIREGISEGQRHYFIHFLINGLIHKFNRGEEELAKTLLPIAQRCGLPEREVKEKIRYWKAEKKEYEPRTLCKHGREARLCENPRECYFFAKPARVSDLCAALIGEQAVIEGQIVGEKSQMAVPKTIEAECSNCAAREIIDTTRNPRILNGCVLGTKELDKQVERFFNSTHGEACAGKDPKKKTHSIRYFEKEHLDYALLWIRDPLEKLGLERFDKRSHNPREVHLVGPTVPNAKKVRLWGEVAIDSKKNITIIANRVEPLESEFMGFIPTEEDKRAWAEHFGDGKNVHKEIAPHIVGEKRKISKKLCSLVYHSPPMIKDIHGRGIMGRINLAFYGDTTAGKSQTAKDLTDGSESGWTVPLGVYSVAETGGRTGLLYTIDNDKHALIWGELVLNDLGLVVVDGLEKISPEEFGEFRETIRTGKISVKRSIIGDAWARTRLMGCFNPKKPMNQYLYPCQAISNTWTFEDPTNITRWDIFVPFALDDVAAEEIANGVIGERPVPPEVFARHIYWVWSRKPDQIVYELGAVEEIKTATKELIETYSTQSLPIISMESFGTVCRLAVARACEVHSTDEKHEKVIVKPEHVKSAVEDFKEVLKLLKLGEYKLDEDGKNNITEEDFCGILRDLDRDLDLRVLDKIKMGKAATAEELAQVLKVSERTIKDNYARLKAHGLIETKQGKGTQITARGICFVRKIMIKGKDLPPPEKREGQQKIGGAE